jgi:hypothetical protein
MLEESRVRVVQTPFQAPNCNAHAERFVRSIKEECLNRVMPIGERHLRRAMHEFVEHYHHERTHQGLDNKLSTATHLLWTLAGFAVVNDSEACSTTITARRDGIASVGSAEFWDTTPSLSLKLSLPARKNPRQNSGERVIGPVSGRRRVFQPLHASASV